MRCISVASRPPGRALEVTGRHPGPPRDATCFAPRCPAAAGLLQAGRHRAGRGEHSSRLAAPISAA